MCTTIQTYGNTGLATVSVANANLNGTGTIVPVITLLSGSSGTTINSITIKAQGNNAEGMIRLFMYNGTTATLYQEIPVPANVQSAVIAAYEVTLTQPIVLSSGWSLYASTQNADTFNIIANATDWVQCPCTTDDGACCSEQQMFSTTGTVNIATANSSLNGSGTLGHVITAPVACPVNPLSAGLMINTVNIKATASNSQGIVRLFVTNGTTNYLLTEIPIAANVQTGIQPAYRTMCSLNLFLRPGYSLLASTQNADSFNVTTDATNFINCACLS